MGAYAVDLVVCTANGLRKPNKRRDLAQSIEADEDLDQQHVNFECIIQGRILACIPLASHHQRLAIFLQNPTLHLPPQPKSPKIHNPRPPILRPPVLLPVIIRSPIIYKNAESILIAGAAATQANHQQETAPQHAQGSLQIQTNGSEEAVESVGVGWAVDHFNSVSGTYAVQHRLLSRVCKHQERI